MEQEPQKKTQKKSQKAPPKPAAKPDDASKKRGLVLQKPAVKKPVGKKPKRAAVPQVPENWSLFEDNDFTFT